MNPITYHALTWATIKRLSERFNIPAETLARMVLSGISHKSPRRPHETLRYLRNYLETRP